MRTKITFILVYLPSSATDSFCVKRSDLLLKYRKFWHLREAEKTCQVFTPILKARSEGREPTFSPIN